MAWILGSGCSNAAGANRSEFWQSLQEGRAGLANSPQSLGWEKPIEADVREFLGEKLTSVYQEMKRELNSTALARLADGDRLGVILASTKGFLEDFIWDEKSPDKNLDPMSGLLEDFLQDADLHPIRSICVSNACASSISALKLAQIWLASGSFDEVLVLACDYAGPFVRKGFEALQLLTSDQIRPFDQNRSGFFLGDGASAILVSNFQENSKLWLNPVGLEAEGSAVTRPTSSGASLVRAAQQIPDLLNPPPDLVIAHGTGTRINDETEDLAFFQLFGELKNPPFITGTKWCVGHTLGSSGSFDLIAAGEILKTQKTFALANTENLDASLKGHYLTKKTPPFSGKLRKILISSLGFGGIQSSAVLELKS